MHERLGDKVREAWTCREVSNKSQRIHWTKNVEYAAERQEEKTSEVYGNSEEYMQKAGVVKAEVDDLMF